jgi:hypothetical protein
MQYLPLKADGSVSWAPSPSDVTQQYAIGTVASDWSVTQLQASNSAFKIVHDAGCSNPPTLDLPLSTTVQTLAVSGTLTVGATPIDVGAALAQLSGTWANLPLSSQVTAVSGQTPQYMVRDGTVYLKGAVTKAGGGAFVYITQICQMPSEARPSVNAFVLLPSMDQDRTLIRAEIQSATSQWTGNFDLKAWPATRSGVSGDEAPDQVQLTSFYYL